MQNYSLALCASLLHSFWQAALLWLAFKAISKSLGAYFTASQKRMVLAILLGMQLLLFIITFIVQFNKPNSWASFLVLQTALVKLFQTSFFVNVTLVCTYTYMCIVSFKCIKIVYRWYAFKKQISASFIKPPITLKLFTATHQHLFGIKKQVTIWMSNVIDTPITFGFLKPVILLPVALVNKLSVQQTETLLLHELAHIKVNDFLLNWFVVFTETVFFYNPFVVSLCKQLKLEREKNCDITVTAFNYQPVLYADALLAAQTFKQKATTLLLKNLHVAAVSKPHYLLQRIQFFTNPLNQLQANSSKKFVPYAFLIFPITICLIVISQLNINVVRQQNAQAIAAMPKLDVSLQKINNKVLPVFLNEVLASLPGDKLESIATELKKQTPAIETAIKKVQPVIENIAVQADAIITDANESFVMPAALDENVIQHQIVVNEQTSGSKNATIKVYTVIYKHGKWQLIPHWKLAGKEVEPSDSIQLIKNEQSKSAINDTILSNSSKLIKYNTVTF
jgi:beta-lactamase regulating signal transducer with metallopeptidase domain